jgi:biotin carboxylase
VARVLLLLPTTSYRWDDFLAGARALEVEAAVASDRCHVLAEAWPADAGLSPERSLAIDLRDPEAAAGAICEAARAAPFDAIVPTSDDTAVVAAIAARRLGLAGNAPEAAYAARNKRVMREKLRAASVPCPDFVVRALDAPPEPPPFGFPCVVKPLLLSASRGVMRADDPRSLADACARLARLLARPDLAQADADPARLQILIERFVAGPEVALEGLLAAGALETLALFDKPDPLDGPFFEETIYVTPSRLPASVQAAIGEVTARAARAIGLSEGPVHAELRLAPEGPQVIEVAARSIGGLCARTLRFSLGGRGAVSLEELVIARALGRATHAAERRAGAAGVMMIPIPRGGVLKEVRGLERARAVPGIVEAAVTARAGETLVPLPEGASYLGFLFARGESPEEVEAALRAAHRRLDFEVAPLL